MSARPPAATNGTPVGSAAEDSTLAAIVRSSPDAIIAKTVDGQITSWNAAAERLFGYAAAEIIGRNIDVTFPLESRKQERDRHARVAGGAAESGFRCKRIRRDGTPIDVVMSMTPVYDETGRLVTIASISRPVTVEERAEARYGSLLEAGPDATVCVDAFGQIVTVNAQVTSLFGYDRQELVGQAVEMLLPGELASVHAAHRTEFMNDPKTRSMGVGVFLTGRRKDGSIFPVEVSLAPDLTSGDLLVIAAVRDVSQQRAAEAAAKETESRLREVTESVDIVFALLQLEPFRYLYVSSGVRAVLGREPEDIVASGLPLLAENAVDQTRLMDDRRSAVAGKAVGTEHQITLPDGRRRWMRATAAPVPNPDGPAERAVITVQDITERVEAARALAESETRLRQLAESVDIVFVLRQREPAAYLYVSPGSLPVLGYTPAQIMADRDILWKIVYPEDQPRVKDEYLDPARAGKLATSEYRIVMPDGSIRHVRSTATPVANDGRDSNRIVIVTQDITARVLTSEALLAAEIAARRANEAKSEFLSRMSHELRTPLNAVLGFGQLLERQLHDTEYAESLRYIVKGGRHLLELINDVLDIARIESRDVSISSEPVPVAEVVEETVELMRPLAQEGSVTLNNSSGRAGVYVLADRQRLRQILLNLISNAIKYNQRGGHVWVSWDAHVESVSLSVRDDGQGIARELQHRLFTPFDRLGAESGDVEGSGIGLALTRSLIDMMGGQISVESARGKGSRFTLELPATSMATASSSPVGTIPESRSALSDIGPRATLLYIEDNAPNVTVVEHLLRLRPQWHLVHSATGSLGLELAEAHRPDLILLDLHLPDRSGREVLADLKRRPHLRDIPVVILTADVRAGQSRELIASGAAGYLTKPLDLDEVLGILDDAWEAKRARG